MIEIAVQQMLVGTPAVAALVGTRVYPMVLPQAPEYPAITYQIITGDSHYVMEGPAALASPRFQLDLYAKTSLALFQLKGAVMAAMSGARGSFGSPPVRIFGVFRAMELDAFEQELERSGPRVWRKTLDFNLWFKEQYDG